MSKIASKTAAKPLAGRHLRRLAAVEAAPIAAAAAIEGVLHRQIRPDPQNPRKSFDDDGLQELKASIVRDGLVEPLAIRPIPGGPAADGPQAYMLIAGERRWQAIRLAIEEGAWPADQPIDVTIKDVDEPTARRLALVENLQRRDLKPLEEARALQALADLTGASAAQIGRDLGFSERWAQQRLALIAMPAPMQKRLESGELTVEQARQVPGIWDRLPVIKQVQLRDGMIDVADAKAWLAKQPKPLELSHERELILLEVGWALAGKSNGWWTETPCDHMVCSWGQALEDEDLLKFSTPYGSAQRQVRLTQKSYSHLLAISGGDDKLTRTALEPLLKKARIFACGGSPLHPQGGRREVWAEVDQLFKSKRYVTPWLNAPFRPDPTKVAERQRQLDHATAEQEANQREEVARQQERAAAKAALDQEEADARGMIAELLALEAAEVPTWPAAFCDLLRRAGYIGPFAVTLTEPEYSWEKPEPIIQDAEGLRWMGGPAKVELLRRLMAAALNMSLGHGLSSGPAFEAPWSSAPEAEAQEDIDDDQVDLEEALEAGARDEDLEIPPTLRRLAGGQPEPVEAE